jgi:hypothetical protein
MYRSATRSAKVIRIVADRSRIWRRSIEHVINGLVYGVPLVLLLIVSTIGTEAAAVVFAGLGFFVLAALLLVALNLHRQLQSAPALEIDSEASSMTLLSPEGKSVQIDLEYSDAVELKQGGIRLVREGRVVAEVPRGSLTDEEAEDFVERAQEQLRKR